MNNVAESMALLGERAFALTVGAPPAFTPEVALLRGVEALSRPYRFDVTVASARWDLTIDRDALLAAPACLLWRVPSGARALHGVITAVRELGHGNEPRHRLRIEPRLALLRHTRNSRVFQDRSIPEVVTTVLHEGRVTHDWRLLGTYPKRAYCVQYEESDYDFVARLLAEEGIWYAFEHRDVEVMVLADHAMQYQPIEGDAELALAVNQGLAAGEHVTAFAAGRAVRPGAVRLRRYDFQRPTTNHSADASIAAALVGPTSTRAGERRAVNPLDLRIYDHHADYEEGGALQPAATRMLGQYRRNAESGRGASNCRRLTPGRYFSLLDASDGFEGDYVVTRIEHHGRPAAVAGGPVRAEYENAFRCVPRVVNHLPARPERGPRHGLETATVVGPSGEEIHTDELGRVKVQFHWDLGGRNDERSSCWLRVVQGFTGQLYGAQFIPRVGTEVVVGFFGGDTDRPVIMGGVYNGTHAPPFKLPAEKTRSGVRTRSTGDGEGYNELSFEDAAGREEVRLHAQRDLQEIVGHDRSSEMGGDLSVVVAGNSMETIGGERVEVVRGGRASTVMGDASRHVVGAERAVVDGDRVEIIQGGAELIAQRASTRIHEHEERVVLGDARASVRGDRIERVEGCATMQVGQADVPASHAVHVEGLAELHGRRGATLSSDEEITLTCGRSSIRLTPDQIELVAPRIFVTAEGAGAILGGDELRVRASGAASVLADTIVLRGERASLALDADARLGGDKVRLGKVDDAEDFAPGPQTPPTRIELVDQDGRPVAYRRYKLFLADGSTRAGLLDRDGVAVIDLDLSANIVFDGVHDLHAR